MHLHELKSPKGSRKRRKIVGRGRGSGWGKTAGRGENGQKSKCAGNPLAGGLEGGQMPLIRRLPKMGFRSHRPVLNQVVNIADLNRFQKGATISAETLKSAGLISSLNKPFKILGEGELKKPLTIQAASISKSAREKVIKVGGKIEPVGEVSTRQEQRLS